MLRPRWCLLLLLVLCACQRAPEKRLIVLGIDGLDPVLLQRFMEEGKLPNFARLKELGSMQTLGTSNPPQSPVAWATFTTGTDPGGHGIFDFVHRDPKTMRPVPSVSEVDERGEARLLRKGEPFWSYLVEAGVPCTLLKVAANFPPDGLPGQVLTGMGTPDLEGSYGTFTYYTTAEEEPPEDLSGGRFVKVRAQKGVVRAAVVGPGEDSAPLRVGLEAASALIEVGEEHRLLRVGEWSDWIPVGFPTARGMVRFYLKSAYPDLRLYASPVNMDPCAPAQAITSPESFSRHLCRHCGRFYTQGMPEDTKALVHGVLDDGEFREQSQLVIQERRRLFEQGLKEFDSGLFFFYLATPDILSHMYWNTIDPEHPGYTKERAGPHGDAIASAYQEADYLVGRALELLDARTQLLVLSDHGFAPFYRAFSLNGWLEEEGYLVSDAGTHKPRWPRTRLYGVGFNGLYVNQLGRERDGIVAAQDRERLLDEVTEKLKRLRDPKTGKPLVRSVYRSDEIYSASYRDLAPDLVIGYESGFRASWRSVLARADGPVWEDNLQPWSGDHLIDPEVVPGVLLSSRPLTTSDPDLKDIAPSILSYFGLAQPETMNGRDLLGEAP